MHEDAIAIEAIKSGDRDRYAELVERYSRLVYGIAWSRLGDSNLSEEAAQEAFVQGFRFLGTLRRPESFGAWIGKIARNVASRLQKRNRRTLRSLHRWQLEQGTAAVGEDTDEGTFDKPVQELLSETLEDLSEAHRECLVLFYLRGKSVREAAEALGISENAFKTRLHRARVDLREKLEAQLEPAIRRLEPPQRLRDQVLTVMPVCPIGWGGKGFSFSTLLGGLQAVGPSLLSPLLTLLLVSWVGGEMTRNYREGSEFRKRIIWQNFLLLALFLVPWVVCFAWLSRTWGYRAMFTIMAVYMLPALTQGALMLRVNRSPFIVAMVVGTASMTIGFLAMGLAGLPFVVFLAAMLVFNIGLWWGLKSMPARADYNLFLRAAVGGLREPGSPGTCSRPASPEDMRAFARFLGERFLAVDYSLKRSGCTFYLPPIRNSLVASFLWPIARYNGSSSITVAPDGTCRADLASRDAHHLRSHAAPTALRLSELQARVSAVVGESLRLFLSGDEAEAAKILQSQDDEAIFVQPVHKLTRMRVLFLASIIAAFVGLAGFWIMGERLLPRPERVVTVEDARAAMSGWLSANPRLGSQDYSNLWSSLSAYRIPPASFWGPSDAESLKRFALAGLQQNVLEGPHWAIGCVEGQGRLIHNLVAGDYASIEDLYGVGVTRDAILHGARSMRPTVGQPPLSTIPNENRRAEKRSDNHSRLLAYAYSIWCFEALGCLNDIDTTGAAELLARHQLTGDQPTAGRDPFPANAAGLFWVSDPFFVIEDTWAVLFSLQALGKLDAIDGQACVAGLMRCYRGKGDFTGGCNSGKAGNPELVQSDAYHALESLVMLGALDKVPDLEEWSFRANWCQDRNGKLVAPFITPAGIAAWAWQSRLDELRTGDAASAASQ